VVFVDGLPSDDVEYNFITQIFFITHRCLQIGLNQVCDHYMELMQQLAKLQQKVSEAMAVGGGVGGEVRQLFERAMTRHLAYKAQLLNPPLIESAFQFYVATAHWLTKLAVGEDIGVDSKVDMQSLKTPSIGLCYIPEFVVEDVVQFVIFVRQFSEMTLEVMGDHLPHLLTFITVFMGNAQLVHNPHLRATIAEMLSLLIPQSKDTDLASMAQTMQRTRLFENHLFAHSQLMRALLQVFIDIEFTGHAMQFEQKFSYRLPMYSALEYTWKLKPFRLSVIALADEVKEI
jgi:ubiquitin conjugation factor E4 A